ncbi:MAG: hypothetical protein A2X86_20085 [Bdellovibrionales bacterium GWA2_49_15]|nr:MAG: hypothetical protein A2X86_20085 [Bdellovibrionales bacterium GWA2_49_15]HAZ11388.1 hypothetical protein [Bdellovibrionales bacterium]
MSFFILFTVVFISVQSDDDCLLLDKTNSISQIIHEHQQECTKENSFSSCPALCIIHSVANIQLTSNSRNIFENYILSCTSFSFLSPIKLRDNSLQEIKPPSCKLV